MPKNLTTKQIEELLKEPGKHMQYFDYQTESWNAAPNGTAPVSIAALRVMRDVLECDENFGGRKLAVIAVKLTSVDYYPGDAQFNMVVPYAHKSCVVGNIIAYNPATNKYETHPAGYFGVYRFVSSTHAIDGGMQALVSDLERNKLIRRIFLAPYKAKQK